MYFFIIHRFIFLNSNQKNFISADHCVCSWNWKRPARFYLYRLIVTILQITFVIMVCFIFYVSAYKMSHLKWVSKSVNFAFRRISIFDGLWVRESILSSDQAFSKSDKRQQGFHWSKRREKIHKVFSRPWIPTCKPFQQISYQVKAFSGYQGSRHRRVGLEEVPGSW